MRVLAGWRGAAIIASLAAVALGLPLVVGTSDHTLWDWGFLFVTIVFVMLPIMSLLHVGLTVVLARTLSGRERWIELTSVIVPCAYFAWLCSL